MELWFETSAARAAIEAIENGRAGLMILRGERVVFSAATPGIRAALSAHDDGLLQDAVMIDRVVGAAAAMVFADGGAVAVYGSIMSQRAWEDLTAKGIAVRAKQIVPHIINRKGDGLCPMELAVDGITEPTEGIKCLRQTVQRLMAAQTEANHG